MGDKQEILLKLQKLSEQISDENYRLWELTAWFGVAILGMVVLTLLTAAEKD